MVDKLRDLVEERDIPKLMEMVMATGVDFELAVSLLRKFDTRADVKSFLLDQWNRFDDFEHRIVLMWRVLDDENLDLNVHENIYTFVKNNKERFMEEIVEWYGGAERVLDAVKSRLSDSSFPRTKDWVYLYLATGSSDRNAATELVKSYANSKNGFLRKVVEEVLPCLEKE